jgi:hypothetical protein
MIDVPETTNNKQQTINNPKCTSSKKPENRSPQSKAGRMIFFTRVRKICYASYPSSSTSFMADKLNPDQIKYGNKKSCVFIVR